MVALGAGAQTLDRRADPVRRHQHDHGVAPATSGRAACARARATPARSSPDDAQAIAQVPGVQYVAAASNTRGQIVAGNQNWNTQIQGTDVDFPLIRSWQTPTGAFFTPQDVADGGQSRRARHHAFAISCSGPATTRSARSFACHRAASAATSRTSPSPSSA